MICFTDSLSDSSTLLLYSLIYVCTCNILILSTLIQTYYLFISLSPLLDALDLLPRLHNQLLMRLDLLPQLLNFQTGTRLTISNHLINLRLQFFDGILLLHDLLLFTSYLLGMHFFEFTVVFHFFFGFAILGRSC